MLGNWNGATIILVHCIDFDHLHFDYSQYIWKGMLLKNRCGQNSNEDCNRDEGDANMMTNANDE